MNGFLYCTKERRLAVLQRQVQVSGVAAHGAVEVQAEAGRRALSCSAAPASVSSVSTTRSAPEARSLSPYSGDPRCFAARQVLRDPARDGQRGGRGRGLRQPRLFLVLRFGLEPPRLRRGAARRLLHRQRATEYEHATGRSLARHWTLATERTERAKASPSSAFSGSRGPLVERNGGKEARKAWLLRTDLLHGGRSSSFSGGAWQ